MDFQMISADFFSPTSGNTPGGKALGLFHTMGLEAFRMEYAVFLPAALFEILLDKFSFCTATG